MSYALTTQQIMDEDKEVTRRLGWWNSKPGEIVNACKKCMGLKKGEKVRRLKLIEFTNIRMDPLNDITDEDLIKEGFPDWTRCQFMRFFLESHKGKWKMFHDWGCFRPVNRIGFKYIQPQTKVAE